MTTDTPPYQTYDSLRERATPLGLFVIEQLKQQHLKFIGLAKFLSIRPDKLDSLLDKHVNNQLTSRQLILLARYFSVSFDEIIKHYCGATDLEHERALRHYELYLQSTPEQRAIVDAVQATYAQQRQSTEQERS